MARLTRLEPGVSGIADLDAQMVAAAAGGDTYPNDDRTVLVVTNGGGSSVTVTPTIQRTSTKAPGFGQISTPSRAVAVAAGKTAFIHCPAAAFNNVDGLVAVTYSGVTSVKVAAVKLPKVD